MKPGWEKFAHWRAKGGLGGFMPILRLIGAVKTLMQHTLHHFAKIYGWFSSASRKSNKGATLFLLTVNLISQFLLKFC